MAIFGEISKRPIGIEDEKKHFESVRMQMGRVQLDSDWNEAFDLLIKSRGRALRDIIGRYGSPNDGFRIDKLLILDHLDSKEGWTAYGNEAWGIEHFEKFEGKGSFRLSGDIKVERRLPEVLKNLFAPAPKLKLMFKVSAVEDATIELSLNPANPAISSKITHVCGSSWEEITLDLSGTDLTLYETISIHVKTEGTVYLDCLMIDPGIINDSSKDFYIHGSDGSDDGAGRYYVEGLVSIKEGFETYLTQKDYPEAPAIDLGTSKKLAYLDVWKRTVTWVEDPQILEPALGGPDTCTREQVVSQVKVMDSNDGCTSDIGTLKRDKKAATLTAKLSPKSEQDKCDFRPEVDYTGLNNSLYRIEIHKGGDKGNASFKWSRNNGSDLTAILEFSSDDTSVIVPDGRGLCCGDWVELCDDVSDLADFSESDKHGKLAKVSSVDTVDEGAKVTLDFESSGLAPTTAPFKDRDPKLRHPKLRKWHGVELVKNFMGINTVVPEKELEHGIRVAFSDAHFYHGDFWQFGARVNTRSIEELVDRPPMGPVHHYAPLSVVEKDISYSDCRKTFPPLTALTASDIAFDPGLCGKTEANGVENVQQAIEALCLRPCCTETVAPGESISDAIARIGPEGGSICLLPGVHIVEDTVAIENRRNITIRGEGAATKVVFKHKSGKDLFRVKGSEEIAFERFLMLSAGAHSIISVEECRSVSISGCHILNLPESGVAAGGAVDRKFLGAPRREVEKGNGWMVASVRLADCCRLTLKENRIASMIGVLQHGGGDAAKTPLIKGLNCVGNTLSVLNAGLVLIECDESAIEGNEVLPLAGDIKKIWELLKKITTANTDCVAEVSDVFNSVIDNIVTLVFGCADEKAPETVMGVGCGVFFLRSSIIRKNRFGGARGLYIFYSDGNTISGNCLECRQEGLYLGYGFDTKISGNTFEASGSYASVPSAEVSAKMDNVAMPSRTGAVVSLRFADRLRFSENWIKGMNGVVIGNENDKFLWHLDHFSGLWETSPRQDAAITLAKRFTELAGLAPFINLIEVLLETFYGLSLVDWVEILIRSGLDKDSIPDDYKDLSKSPFVKALVGLFEYMAETALVSRTEFKGNRFEVDGYGVKMDGGMTVGGVRVFENRFSGAEKTAILLKPQFMYSNPELSGMILSCAYDLMLYALQTVAKFLGNLAGSYNVSGSEGGTASPAEVALSMAVLHGLGQNFRFFNNTGGTSSAKVLEDVIKALDGLIEQLSDEDLMEKISDLSANDYRISRNEIRGKGNGINTNIVNVVIESNRIDIEPGSSAIAELFSAGRVISTDWNVANDRDSSGNPIHSVIASLGLALLDMNPSELDTVIEMLTDAAGQKWLQWRGLGKVLVDVINIIDKPSVTRDACDKAKALEEAVRLDTLTNDVSAEFVTALRGHLQGYGIILENPGAQVLNNRIEATGSCGLGVSNTGYLKKAKSAILRGEERLAPGGILMTADAGKLAGIFYYLLFVEEMSPKANWGGQGTLFSGNSIQWGAGHGLSVSAIPIMTDCKIVQNEIQNHGLSGVLSDSLVFNLLVAGNEINNCYLSRASGVELNARLAIPNMFGGLTVCNAMAATCSDNRINGCGRAPDGWPALGAALIDCAGVSFQNNSVSGNGRDAKDAADERLYLRGGVAFMRAGFGRMPATGAMDFTFNSNNFSKNKGQTLLFFSGPFYGKVFIQANGNKIGIDDLGGFRTPKIFIKYCSDLLFTGNQILLPVKNASLSWVEMHGTNLVFNNNRVMGNASLSPIVLAAASKGMAIGNFLYRDFDAASSNIIMDHNIF